MLNVKKSFTLDSYEFKMKNINLLRYMKYSLYRIASKAI